MADFTSGFWTYFISIGTLGGIFGMIWLNWWLNRTPTQKEGEAVESMGHIWDGDLEELNNPIPKWWLNMFYATIVFGLIYLVLYPGLGSFPGLLGWTQEGQWEEEVAIADSRFGALYDEYLVRDIRELVEDEQVVGMGERLFVNYCSVCHGSDAGGGPGYPNLRDNDWLYGGNPEQIKHSILEGRNGIMPPWQQVLGEDGVQQVTQYVLSLNGRQHDAQRAEEGSKLYAANCVACHGADGKGNTALGAPNLTNNIWLYGGSPKAIVQTIAEGRQGQMPAQRDFLGEAKVHLLATYVYSLSRN